MSFQEFQDVNLLRPKILLYLQPMTEFLIKLLVIMKSEGRREWKKLKKTLSKLAEGTHVVVQDHKTKRWMTKGVVLELKNKRGSYLP